MILNTESLPGSPGGLNETSLPAESAKRTAVQPMAACAAILLLLLTGCQAKHMEISLVSAENKFSAKVLGKGSD